VRHPNPLIRVFAARGYASKNAEDIFFTVYLFRRPEAGGLKVPHDIEWYQRALAREESGKEENDETV